MERQSRRTWPAHPHDPVPTAAQPPAQAVETPPPSTQTAAAPTRATANPGTKSSDRRS